jgi:hypothetical protein
MTTVSLPIPNGVAAGAPLIDVRPCNKPRTSASTGAFRIVDPPECVFGANELSVTLDRAGSCAGVLYVSSRPKDNAWIIECDRELDQLNELQEDWDTHGAAPPNTTAITLAKMVVRELAAANLRQFRVEPSVEEGICVSFRRGDVYADIETFNSGEVVAAFSDGRGTPAVWDVESTDDGIRQATRLIRDHLKNHNS